jgi:hypothetical protein
MLLARKGYEVLVVDRATFPSDTVSTHLLHPPGVAALGRWGLLDRLVATGCPPIDTYAFDFGPFTLSGSPGTDDTPVAYGPRRTVLDKLLVDAAAEAGAEVREGFSVTDVVVEDGRVTGIRGHGADGRATTEQARVVIGADGRHSRVARAVRPDQYHERPPLLCGYYSYWSGLPMDGRFQTWIRPDRAFAAGSAPPPARPGSSARRWPTGSARPMGRAGRWSGTPATGTSSPPRACRTPSGTPSGAPAPWTRRSPASAPSTPPWPPTRPPATPRSLAMYEFTCQLATLQPPPPDLQRLLAAAHGNQAAMDGFARVSAGVTSPAEFFSDQNVLLRPVADQRASRPAPRR